MEKENAVLNQGENVLPQSIEEMDDEAFDAYIESAKNSDGEVQAEKNSGEAEPANGSADEPYISFSTKEELQEYQNQTIGNRLREIREAGEKERERFSELFELAKTRYGAKEDSEAVSRLIDELEMKNAANAGGYSAADEIRLLSNEINYQRQVEAIQNDWIRQGEALKKIVPDFDLEKAFENPGFYESVVEGHKTLAEAYPLLQKKAPRRTISEIGNLTNGVAGNINHDVKSMSDREFDEYIRKIKNS